MRSGLRLSFHPILWTLLPLLGLSVPSHAIAAPASADAAVASRLKRDIAQLTQYPTRVAGSPGNRAAAAYMQRRFQEIGLQNVRADQFDVTVPQTRRAAQISIGGRALPLFPMYPNHIAPASTPKNGLTGALIYAGKGRPADFNGLQVRDSIVALDFNSGLNWITAADLGARAIIFLAPDASSANRTESEQKFSGLPLEIPRFYANGATALAISPALAATRATQPFQGRLVAPQATLTSQVTWERVKASNILGTIAGTDESLKGKPGSTLVIGGYYDSMSVAPDLAPGAEAAGNAAALLELARYFKANPPRYSLLFVAGGAHHIALAGMRQFVASHFFDATGKGGDALKDEIKGYKGFIGIDLTSRTNTVGLFAKAAFYNQMSTGSENILLNQYTDFAKAIERHSEALATSRGVQPAEFYMDGIRGLEGRTWRSLLPAPVALDAEVSTLAAKPSVSFATANDARLLQDTPFDTVERMNVGNLATQTSTVATLLSQTINSGGAGAKAEDEVTLLPAESNFSKIFGFAIGRGIYRNMESGTSFLPDSPIPDDQILPANQQDGMRAVGYILDKAATPGPLRQSYKTYCGVRGAFIERATYSKGGNGQPPVAQFVFTGPRVGDSKGGGTPDYEIETYSVSGAGRVVFAPDMGSERSRFSPLFKKVSATISYKDQKLGLFNVDASTICFPCRATAVFDTVDQRYFSVLRDMTILDGQTDSTPVEFGFMQTSAAPGSADIEPVGIVFAKPKTRFKMIMAQGLLGKRLVLLQTQPDPSGNSEANRADEILGQGKDDIIFEGAGFTVPDNPNANSIVNVSYQTARDLWILDQQRIFLLKKFGISNERVDALHQDAGGNGRVGGDPKGKVLEITRPNGGALKEATAALAALKYDQFYLSARRAFGLESRAYPDVEATAQDVLKGIIFYLALLLPFSYFVERLAFGFPDVRKQIMGTSFCFLLVFTCIRFVHPAFELALTPFIILLAFVILALTVVVTSFLSSKFEAEIKRLKQGVHFADVGRLSAIGAALGLGIANMRRRPIRTVLTCITLILLTFTVLSFTSVTANISNFARPYGEGTPSRQGVLIRQPDWSAMSLASVNSLSNEFGQKFGSVAPRAWVMGRDQAEQTYFRVANAQNPGKFFYAPAMEGYTPQEVTIGSPAVKTLLKGAWFDGSERNVVILPASMLRPQEETSTDAAAAPAATPAADEKPKDTGPPLGMTVDNALNQNVVMAGQNFRVIGVYDDLQWTGRAQAEAGSNVSTANAAEVQAIRDLDDEKITPVDYSADQTKTAQTNVGFANQSGGEVQVQRYEHMDATALPLIPYETALGMGGSTRSLAASFGNSISGREELESLMSRAAIGIFGAVPDKNGKLQSRLYSSVESTSYEGFAALLVPVLIAALIIANTMLGSVFERTREIGIYSSVGLAPIHVAALFIAEAIVYAVLGSISGYLIAQLVAKVVTAYDLLPGITLNYSSSSAVIATLIVMATVLLSTLYPAFQAGRLSQPDSERKFSMSEPDGDVWRFQFPFTVSGAQPLGVAQFLADFFETHTDTSVGVFYTDRVHFSALKLREAVDILNSGSSALAADGAAVHASVYDEGQNASVRGVDTERGAGKRGATIEGGSTDSESGAKKGAAKTAAPVAVDNKAVAESEAPKTILSLATIAADPETEVYRLSMRVWLAPFDMGVSQDTDIVLLPSDEPGLYELQLKLVRQSGEIAAWKRVNRGFMGDLRKQLLLWRTIKPAGQQEYILRGRAHVLGQPLPAEEPGTTVAAVG